MKHHVKQQIIRLYSCEITTSLIARTCKCRNGLLLQLIWSLAALACAEHHIVAMNDGDAVYGLSTDVYDVEAKRHP